MSQPRVLVAMSGGVDSSVAAALLLERGYDVTGVTLKLWGGESDSGCCSVSDVEDARRVAAQLGIPHYVFNFGDDFTAEVIDPYVDAYASGHTPNPCVECNRAIKFGRLFDRAHALGFDFLATGHHARVRRRGEKYELARGADDAKDQSYVLYMLGQRELARSLFPVGELTKAEVRAHATALGLRTADKPESMDVCFVKKGGRVEFLDQRAPMRAGDVVDSSGAVLGTHAGVASFTIGQRRGVGVALGERRYVVDLDTSAAATSRSDHAPTCCAIACTSAISPSSTTNPMAACCTRRCVRTVSRSSRTSTGTTVCFAQPQPRVAPGQVVALYDGDALIGGGIAA